MIYFKDCKSSSLVLTLILTMHAVYLHALHLPLICLTTNLASQVASMKAAGIHNTSQLLGWGFLSSTVSKVQPFSGCMVLQYNKLGRIAQETGEGLGGAGKRKDQHGLTICACSPGGHPVTWLHQNQCGQQVEGGDSPPLLQSGATPPAALCPALGPPTKGHGALEQVQRRLWR